MFSIITVSFYFLLQRILSFPVRAIGYKTAQQGAQTSIYCAVLEKMEGVSGQYLADCKIVKPGKLAMDDEVAEKLWQVSAQMVGLETK